MHIYKTLPLVLSTSFSTHPKPLTWDKKPFQSRRVHSFRHYETFLLFWHCETDFVFRNFFNCSSHQFLIFCNKMDVQKIPKRPPLHFSALCDLPETSKKFRKKSEIFFLIFSFLRAFVVSSCKKSGFRFRVFLSLRYGADLGRSRLVTNWSTTLHESSRQRLLLNN